MGTGPQLPLSPQWADDPRGVELEKLSLPVPGQMPHQDQLGLYLFPSSPQLLAQDPPLWSLRTSLHPAIPKYVCALTTGLGAVEHEAEVAPSWPALKGWAGSGTRNHPAPKIACEVRRGKGRC